MPISHLIAAAAAANGSQFSSPDSTFSSWETLEHELEEAMAVKYPVLIDTDGGTEDAWALLMAIKAHKNPKIPFDIVGITCVHGATSVDHATKNVRRILRSTGLNFIPIFRGSELAMVKTFVNDDDPPYNGHDGFGDAGLPEIDACCVEDTTGVMGIVEIAKKYKGKLRILALGPLTNLALSVRVCPSIQDFIRSIFITGGNMEGIGNATTCAEFNFVSDPEAVHVVLNTFTCPIFVLPWETSLRFGMSTHSWRTDTLGAFPTNEVTLMNKIEGRILKQHQEGWVAQDAICAAAFIEPRVVTKRKKAYCRVELQGSETRGMLVTDHSFRHDTPPNVILIKEVNFNLYQEMLLWAAGGDFYKK